jgi:hypothetical protein
VFCARASALHDRHHGANPLGRHVAGVRRQLQGLAATFRARDDRRLAVTRTKRSPRRFGATGTLDCATQLPVPATKAWKRATEHALKLALEIERIRSVEIVVPVVLIGIGASSAMAGSDRCALLRDTVPDQGEG